MAGHRSAHQDSSSAPTRPPHPTHGPPSDPHPATEPCFWLPTPVHQRWLEPVLLCPHGPFWTLAPGGTSRTQRASMAGGGWPDLRPGEEKLSAAQAGAGHTRDAAGDRGRSQSRLTGIRLLGTAQHRLYRAREFDRPPWSSSAGTPQVGDGEACSTPARPSGVVASLLSFCPSSRSVAGSPRSATTTRGQPSGATLPTTDAGDGSRQSEATMDGARGALVSIGADLRLRGAKAREGWSVRSWSVWRRCSQQHANAALLRGEIASLDCLITKYRPQMGPERAGRFIHHI